MQKLNMILLDRFFALLILAIGCPFLLHSQTNLVIGQTQNVSPGIPTDYTIPDMGGDLAVTLRGGDGGGIRFSGLVCETTVEGGAGATVKATFEVGFGTGQLQPGGTIRAMVGQKGWSDSKACFSGAASYAGGGGSTAILYLPPGADATGINWRLLAVAGAGGGSSRPSTGIDRKGGGATAGDPSGGVNGIAGAYGGADGNYGSDNGVISFARPGAGYLGGSRIPSTAANRGGHCDEGLASDCEGYYSMVESANSDATPILVKLMDNAYYNYTGDRSTSSNNYKNGGNGFTGGGAGSTNVVFGPTGGGGGGGFSGGSVNYYFGGGGGSSHVASGVNTSNISISPGANGASGHHDGFVKMLVNAAPIVTAAKCQNQTVQLNASGNASLNASQLNNGSTGFAPLAFTVNGQQTLNFSCADVGSKGVTLTLTDVYNSTSTCSATITVQDNVGPTAACQDVNVQLNAAGTGFISTCSLDAGSTDACGGFVGYALSQTSFSCSDVGSKTVTMTVTDINGNASTCTANVIVQDNIRPVALCQNVSVQLDANGSASVAASAVNNSSSDICGIANYTLDQTNFTCDNTGPNPVLLTVTDVNGNTSTCTATVTVHDNMGPIASCQDVIVQLDANGSASLTVQEVDNNSSDVCGIASRTLSLTSFTCANLGSTSTTLTVTDKSGLSSTCTARVSVRDNIRPTAQCQDLIVQLDENGQVTVDANQFDNGSMDNCSLNRLYFNDFSPFKTFGCNDLGTLSLSNVIVEDNAGILNYCNLTLTIEDNVAPVALCQDISIQLEANGSKVITPADIDKGSSDACGIASLSLAVGNYSCETQGAVIETLTVTDVNGLSSSCTATVTVNSAPIARCKDITAQLGTDGDILLTPADIDDDSYAPCGIADMTLSNGYYYCETLGSYTETLTVIDQYGQSTSCTATVTVDGTPVARCKDITVRLESDGDILLTPADIDDGSSIPCFLESMTLSNGYYYCETLGSYTETLTVTDQYGQSSSCTATVTVDGAPVARCKDITVRLESDGDILLTPADIDDGSSIPCFLEKMTISNGYYYCETLGSYTETLTVTDQYGQSSSCTATVTVEDTVKPALVCQNLTVSFNGEESLSLLPTDIFIAEESYDVCGPVTFVSQSQSIINCAEVGNTLAIEVIAQDPNGNSNSCTAMVTVEGIPCGLTEVSIGCAEGANTSYDANQDQFTITSEGCFDYPGESIAFTGTRLCGDSEVIIHLEDVEGSGYAGILMRESLDPGSRMVGIASDLSQDVRAEYRITTDGNLFRSVKRRSGAEWFKIVRTGNKFKSYTSVNGSDWRLLRTTNFDNMSECMYVGIQAYSINGNAIFTATIDEFIITTDNSSNLERPENHPQTAPLGVVMQEQSSQSEYDLSIAPNPFSHETSISFSLDKTAEVSLTLFDLQGQMVKQLTKGQFQPGRYQEHWDSSNEAGTSLPSGVYLVQLQIGSEIISKTVVLQR